MSGPVSVQRRIVFVAFELKRRPPPESDVLSITYAQHARIRRGKAAFPSQDGEAPGRARAFHPGPVALTLHQEKQPRPVKKGKTPRSGP